MSYGTELRAAGIIVPANPENPVAKAEHIEMPDGSRLSEFKPVTSWNDLKDKPFGDVFRFPPFTLPGDLAMDTDGIDLSEYLGEPSGAYVFYPVRTGIVNWREEMFDDLAAVVKDWDGHSAVNIEKITEFPLPDQASLFSYNVYSENGDELESLCYGIILLDVGGNIPGGDNLWAVYKATAPLRYPDVLFFVADTKQVAHQYLPMEDIQQGIVPQIEGRTGDGTETLEPETYYQFGEVSALSVSLVEKDDGKAHEYTFEFIPTENFQGLTITPEPAWIVEPQFPVGKRCIVSICMGLAVMGCG